MSRGLLGVFVFSLLLAPAFAQTPAPKPRPSFDCAKAKGRALRLVCDNSVLAALDVEEASMLRRARAKAAAPDAINAEEDEWTGYRNDCPDTACLADAYRGRIAELHRWVN